MSTGLRGLKSGTDLMGRAMGGGAPLTPEAAEKLGAAFVRWLKERGLDNPRIALGRDSRLTGEALLAACAQGCMQEGAKAESYGICTTPALYKSLITEGFACDGAIMVTGCYHPYDWNGLKFFTKDGGIDSPDLDALLALAEEDRPRSEKRLSPESRDFLPVYCRQLADRVRQGLDTDVQKPLLGLHVVVDAGSGAGGFYASLLSDLGAWIEGSQALEPDGSFPHHAPDLEDANALKPLQETVVKVGADLGVIFDPDCDRAAIVDHTGRVIHRNRLIALVSAVLLDKTPGVTILTDSVTSSGLDRFIMEWGGEHYRYKRGFRKVKNEARRLNEMGVNCPLAIETSGHAGFRENNFLDDGLYLATVLICEAMRLKQEGKALSDLIADLREPVESTELRLSLPGEDFHAAGIAAIDKVLDHAAFTPGWHIAPDSREGVRINFDLNGEFMNGWFLLRLSVKDPVLALNIESDVPGGVQEMARALLGVLEGAAEIDLEKLRALAAQ